MYRVGNHRTRLQTRLLWGIESIEIGLDAVENAIRCIGWYSGDCSILRVNAFRYLLRMAVVIQHSRKNGYKEHSLHQVSQVVAFDGSTRCSIRL